MTAKAKTNLPPCVSVDRTVKELALLQSLILNYVIPPVVTGVHLAGISRDPDTIDTVSEQMF